MTDTVSLREQFRPVRTKVLFVGESPPANGTFFFKGDSMLAAHTCKAFAEIYGDFSDMDSFLSCFKDLGCFLFDLCSEPANRLPRRDRVKERREAVPALVSTITQLSPSAIIVVMRAIDHHVRSAASEANAVNSFYSLPFPAQGHQLRYVSGLTEALSDLIKKRILAEAC